MKPVDVTVNVAVVAIMAQPDLQIKHQKAKNAAKKF